MKINKIYFILFALILLGTLAPCFASDANQTEVLNNHNNDLLMSDSIYVDVNNGDDINDGKTQDTSVKSFSKAIEIAKNNDTIYLSDGIYEGLDNTKITLDKSLNVYGSQNTTFDAKFSSYLFIVPDNVCLSFKNINFINAYKDISDTELISGYFDEGIYGAALDIKNAKVTLDNCYFKYNLANYNSFSSEFVYGGAISNLGDLTILNTIFDGNAVGANGNILAYGGAVYNRAKLIINNSKFIDSSGYTRCYGGAIYNDGEAIMDRSIIQKSILGEETKGSAIYNAGNFTLLNSLIENNSIESSDSYYIYGAIFNSGKFKAKSNIFKNNTGVYKPPFTEYIGSPTIYNVGDLDLIYNAFVDNVGFNGISSDIYLTGGGDIKIDDNWWKTNENPILLNKLNLNVLNSWITSKLTPEYSSIKINDNVNISHVWMSTKGNIISNNLVPAFKVEISCFAGGKQISRSFMTNESQSFNFNNTSSKSSYIITGIVDSVESEAIVDVGKINTYIEFIINNNTFFVNDEIRINVSLRDENGNPISARLNIALNDDIDFIDVDGGRGYKVFSNLDPKIYTLTFNYNGDSNYARSFNQTTFTVNKSKSYISIDEVGNINTSDNVKLNVFLNSSQGGLSNLYINGKFIQTVYLNNGNNTFNLNYFEEGSYNITVIYPGNEYSESSKASVFFNVSKSQAIIKVYCQNITAGNDEIITIEVSPDNFNSEVILSINGINSTVLLKNSINPITISRLTNGTYDVKVIFNGNSRFYKTNASSSFKVTKGTSSLNVEIEKNNLTGKITVKTNSSKCSGFIDLFINNNQYSKVLYNGEAVFNVEFFPGSNYIYVFYSGDNFYNGSSWNTTIGEPLNPFLIADNITGYEYNDLLYSVILCEESGFAVPNKNIDIEFLGETFTITTNNYGIAYFKLNLKQGNYTITASYLNSTITNTITVEKVNFNIIAHNISYLDNEVITIDFKHNISGFINFKLADNLKAVIEIKNNTAVWNISNLKAGKYEVEAFYFNDLFNSSSFKSSFSVEKINFTYELDYSGLNYGDTTRIILNLVNTTSGNITLTVDGVSYNKIIESNIVILELSDLSKGSHNLTINYSGDNNFNNYTFNTQFSIRSLKTDLELFINGSTSYGGEVKIIALLSKNATGIVEFCVASYKSKVKITDGTAIWTFGGLNVGNYTVYASYLGDDDYFAISNQINLTVKKADSYIELFTKEVYLDQNIRIYANLSPNATGNVSFSMIGYYSPRNKTVINSTTSWYISPLEYGEYYVLASYFGDANYNPSNTTFILNITQYRSILTVVIDDVGNNSRVSANIRLFNDRGVGISDTVVLTIDSKSYNINTRRGIASFVLGKLPIGNYTFQAVYKGNEKYGKSMVNGSFKVVDSLLNVNLEVSDFTKYVGGVNKLKITLTQSNGKLISNALIQVIINNEVYDLITNMDGICELDINYPAGLYHATVRFNQTDQYYGTQHDINIEILSTIRAIDVIKVYGTGGEYFAIFTDCSGKALANTQVTLTLSDKEYTFKTAPNGIVRVDINVDPGRYSIIAKNPVSGEEAINQIYVFEYIMETKNIVCYFGANKKYTARIFDNNGNPVGANVDVVININNKDYVVKTDSNGYISFKINFKPGTYTIKATYNGFTKDNSIVIKPVLVAKNLIVKKGHIFKFKTKLLNSNGKALKGKKLTFKFKGNKYVAKTNKKGVASIKINLNLKVGNHKIKVLSSKSSIKRIIKVIK